MAQQKLEVDDLHLQLQNLKYESMHLRREISNCLEFRYIYIYTVEPLNNGHIGDKHFVHCSEVVPSSEV